MKKLSYDYYMKIGYSIPVENCHFTIKCFPQSTVRQSVLAQKIDISATSYNEGVDGFANEYELDTSSLKILNLSKTKL